MDIHVRWFAPVLPLVLLLAGCASSEPSSEESSQGALAAGADEAQNSSVPVSQIIAAYINAKSGLSKYTNKPTGELFDDATELQNHSTQPVLIQQWDGANLGKQFLTLSVRIRNVAFNEDYYAIGIYTMNGGRLATGSYRAGQPLTASSFTKDAVPIGEVPTH